MKLDILLCEQGNVYAPILLHLTNTPRLSQEFVLGAIAATVRFPLSRKIVSVRETYVFGKAPERTTIPGPTWRATGYLFPTHDPGRCAKDIYQDIFSSERFKQGYHSQNGQDMFPNLWFFKDRGPSFFIDVGAFNGVLGSNTAHFEKQLKRKGMRSRPSTIRSKVHTSYAV